MWLVHVQPASFNLQLQTLSLLCRKYHWIHSLTSRFVRQLIVSRLVFTAKSLQQSIEDVLTVMAKSLREKLMDEFQEYMSVTMTNWRVNNVMEWWSKKEEKFPNIAKFARKYLAVPTSSAPSQSLLADETHSRT